MSATEWLKRGKATTDPFDALSNYWRGFNALFDACSGTDARAKIKTLLHSTFTEQSACHVLELHVASVAYLMAVPVKDMKDGRKSTARDITTYSAARTAAARLDAVFMVAYQVRCNFEHGQKSPTEARDKELCTHAGQLVSFALEAAA